ncbi:MAG: helix-turn-helix domain-containing protein [Chromatiales bacterium]|jgi:AraC-like DNA-binding protein|nr:helix-turn-helix domain-containing protein [Chromatiales bacterium]MDX9767878.1 helix-turn-helix domain-containing protein [Ectothiorhodospiraceae bacterium]
MKSYKWCVDREIPDRNGDVSKIDIRQDGLELRLERLLFDNRVAVDFSYVDTENEFLVVPTDSAGDTSFEALSFLVMLSGTCRGRLTSGETFVMNPEWGLLANLPGGEMEVVVENGEVARSFGGALPLEMLAELFDGQPCMRELERLLEVNLKTPKRTSFSRSFRITPQIRTLAHDAYYIHRHQDMDDPMRRMCLEGAAMQIFGLALQQNLDELIDRSRSASQVVAFKKSVQEVAGRILANLREPPPFDVLANEVGLSPRRLNEGFKQLYGQSATGWLRRHRMELARNRLREAPDYPVKKLALELGYSHSSNFITAFRREFGQSPSQYARLFRKIS